MAGILERLERRIAGRRSRSAADILVRPPTGEATPSRVGERTPTTIVEAPLNFSAVEIVDLGGDKVTTALPPAPHPSHEAPARRIDSSKDGAPSSELPRWLTTPLPHRGPVGALVLRAHALLRERHGTTPHLPGDAASIRAAVDASSRELTREMRVKPDDITAAAAELTEFMCGYGPLTPLMNDDAVTDVWIDSCDAIRCRRAGAVIQTPLRFRSAEMGAAFLDRLRASIGEIRATSSRFETVVLSDSWRARLSIAYPPTEDVRGLSAAFRIPRVRHATLYEIARLKTVPLRVAAWLESIAHAGTAHILVVGPPGSGRTTFASAVLAAIGSHERIATIEPLPELIPPTAFFERLTTATLTPRGCVDIAARHGADRLGFGDVSGDEGLAFRAALHQGWRGLIGDLRVANGDTARDFLASTRALPSTLTVLVTLTVRGGRYLVSTIDTLAPVAGADPHFTRVVTLADAPLMGAPQWIIEGIEGSIRPTAFGDATRPTSVEGRWPQS